MGLLKQGHPLSWEEIKPYIDYIHKHGILQFINLFNKYKDRQGDSANWGDEIEFTIIKFDDENKKVRVSLRADVILKQLIKEDEANEKAGIINNASWCPEYTNFMLETNPAQPYEADLTCFKKVESNMIRRRAEAVKKLDSNESLTSINFPSLGVQGFSDPEYLPNPNSIGQSIFFPDEIIFQDIPRMLILTENCLKRRGEKIAINVPIFKDSNTKDPFTEEFPNDESRLAAKPDHIYMDFLGFGMGLCCLQITLQAVNIDQARLIYDELTPLTPILLAMSAATPIFRSYLSDVDARWCVLEESIDDRTREERGLEPLKNNKFVIPKPRYSTTDCYICRNSEPYNDIPLQYNEELLQLLRDGGVDELLAKHIAHLFIREPLQVFKERFEQNDYKENEHFETIQSSNWSNMRFKPPPTMESPDIGWRVEVRPMEIQLTDFENTAYACFVVLLTKIIIHHKLEFLIPISKVHQNMKRAQKRAAVLNQKFFFRSNIISNETPQHIKDSVSYNNLDNYEIKEMSVNDIVNGNGSDFPGLIHFMHKYLEEDSKDDSETKSVVKNYLTFIQKRASGELQTLAQWMRNFVLKHNEYEKDSFVKDVIVYEMLKEMDALAKGEKNCEKLLGNFRTNISNVSEAKQELNESLHEQHAS